MMCMTLDCTCCSIEVLAWLLRVHEVDSGAFNSICFLFCFLSYLAHLSLRCWRSGSAWYIVVVQSGGARLFGYLWWLANKEDLPLFSLFAPVTPLSFFQPEKM